MHLRSWVAAGLVLLASCASQPDDKLEPIDLTVRQSPQVTIGSPAPGSFVERAADGMVDVTGSAHGSSILINGKSTPIDSAGKFHARIPAAEGLNVIDAHLSGLLGGVSQRAFLYGAYADPSASIPSGVMLRATAAAFDDHKPDLNDFSSIGRALVAQADLMEYVRQLPPFTWTLGSASVDVVLTDVRFAQDKLGLDLAPRAGGTHADGGLKDLSITLKLTLHYLGTHSGSSTVTVDAVGFAADVDAAYSAAEHAIVASTQAPAIQLGTLDVSTDIDFPGVDDFLTFLANEFKDLIAASVAQQIQANAANHFALELNQFGLPGSFDLSPYGLPATLDVSDAFDGASFDDMGSTLSASTRFAWPQGTGSGPGSIVLGSTGDAAFPAATMAVSVSLDAMNQATFAVWGQHGLERVVYPGKKYPGFKLDPLVAAPALPPVLQTSGDKVQISLGDIVVGTTLHTFLADFPFQVTLSARSDVALDIDPSNGALRMVPAGTPAIWIDINTLLGVVPDALLAPLSDLLAQIAPSIVGKLVKPIEVPLPKMSLEKMIQGSKASIGLAAPVNVTVDTAAKRVTVSGDLAEY